jgi:hypothetical protein
MNYKRTIIVSLTTRMIVRNELLIFGGVGAAAGVCFFCTPARTVAGIDGCGEGCLGRICKQGLQRTKVC